MIEQLLDSKQISPKEFKLYKLFGSELGCECLKEMMDELFWEEPDESLLTEGVLAFYEGRRSVLRGIKAVIGKVEMIINKQHLKVEDNDGSNP